MGGVIQCPSLRFFHFTAKNNFHLHIWRATCPFQPIQGQGRVKLQPTQSTKLKHQSLVISIFVSISSSPWHNFVLCRQKFIIEADIYPNDYCEVSAMKYWDYRPQQVSWSHGSVQVAGEAWCRGQTRGHRWHWPRHDPNIGHMWPGHWSVPVQTPVTPTQWPNYVTS